MAFHRSCCNRLWPSAAASNLPQPSSDIPAADRPLGYHPLPEKIRCCRRQQRIFSVTCQNSINSITRAPIPSTPPPPDHLLQSTIRQQNHRRPLLQQLSPPCIPHLTKQRNLAQTRPPRHGPQTRHRRLGRR